MMAKGTLKILIPFFAILTALIFLMSPVQAATQSVAPQVSTLTNYQPNPSLNANVTWSTFNSSMAWNEYLNSTGGENYINAEPSAFYSNYITINPADIIAPNTLQNNTLGNLKTTWDSSPWSPTTGGTNLSVSTSQETVLGMPEETLSVDVSGTHVGITPGMSYYLQASNYSSQNLEYDYVTFIISLSMPSNSGSDGGMVLWNSTGHAFGATPSLTSGTYYFSKNLEQIQKDIGYTTTWNTTAGAGYSSNLKIYPSMNIPSGAPDGTYSITVNALAMTTYPITFGSNYTGSTVTAATTLQLSNFHPDISNVSIVNGGYTETLSQTLSDLNYTSTQTPISSGNYIEQAGYQADFVLPTAPSLSYTSTNFTLPISVPGSQFQALDINGVSYLNTISTQTNGTAVLLTGVNPNTNTSYLAYVDYTASQWQSISSPAGIFSVAGIEYYWFIAIGAIASLLGLAGAVRHAHTKADQTERVSRMGPRR